MHYKSRNYSNFSNYSDEWKKMTENIQVLWGDNFLSFYLNAISRLDTTSNTSKDVTFNQRDM